MADYENVFCTQTVHRRIPGHIRVIQWLLYFFVLLFTVIGAMWGFVWLFPALGTLFGSWYFMGAVRVTYNYKLEGSRLQVERVSGLKSRQKATDFGDFDLTRLRIMAPEGSQALAEAEEASTNASPKRIVYDVSAHDPDKICSIMYLTGVGQEKDRPLKVYFQPSPEMRDCIRTIAPDRVVGYEQQ